MTSPIRDWNSSNIPDSIRLTAIGILSLYLIIQEVSWEPGGAESGQVGMGEQLGRGWCHSYDKSLFDNAQPIILQIQI